jgi:hypothetical protein
MRISFEMLPTQQSQVLRTFVMREARNGVRTTVGTALPKVGGAILFCAENLTHAELMEQCIYYTKYFFITKQI